MKVWRRKRGGNSGREEGRRAWMRDDRELAVCLLDLELRGIGLHAERIVISIVSLSAYMLPPGTHQTYVVSATMMPVSM